MTVEPDSRQLIRFARALEDGIASFSARAGVLWFGQQALAENERPLLTAFSGGPDSTALVLLTERYARKRGISHKVVLIDHGLRNDSSDEAIRVATRMRNFGIDIAIRRVEAIAPKNGIQNWARRQRYAILTSIARESGAVLLLAHHEADQAETVFMRLSHGSGLAGLGGMRPTCFLADVPVLRPLLEWKQDELLAVCRDFGCGFENDPSNQNRKFERVRVRQSLACLSASGKDMAAGLIRLSAAARSICCSVDAILADQLDLPQLFAEGYAVFSLAALRPLPDDLWRRVVGRSVLAVGGGDYLRSQAAFSRLRSCLEAGASATLGGCRFTLMGGGVFCWILHELGRNPPYVEISASVPIIYAGVWKIVSPLAGHIRMLGDELPPAQWDGLPHALRQTLPIIETLDGRVLYPHFTGVASIASVTGGATATFLALKSEQNSGKEKENGQRVALNTKMPVALTKGGSCRE